MSEWTNGSLINEDVLKSLTLEQLERLAVILEKL